MPRSCGINQQGIQGLKLFELVVNNNEKIIDVSFMPTLIRLCANGSCGINRQSIRGLDINFLYNQFNPNF